MLSGIIATGHVPPIEHLAGATGLATESVRAAARDLEAAHGLVLHPGTDDVWVIPPFSLVPTATWVEGHHRGWWASCIWCALGISALVGDCRIHTRVGGESKELVITVQGDRLEPQGLIAHFPIPVIRAWDNVHRYCGSNQVFENAHQVEPWCHRHGMPRGDIQPLETIRSLAHAWYGGHLSKTWTKWTTAQARQIFARVGLTSQTWALGDGDERF